MSCSFIPLAHFGPGPPPGSGTHHYQFLVYAQQVSVDDMVDVPAPGQSPLRWDVETFLLDNGINPDTYVASFQLRSAWE